MYTAQVLCFWLITYNNNFSLKVVFLFHSFIGLTVDQVFLTEIDMSRANLHKKKIDDVKPYFFREILREVKQSGEIHIVLDCSHLR